MTDDDHRPLPPQPEQQRSPPGLTKEMKPIPDRCRHLVRQGGIVGTFGRPAAGQEGE